MSTNYSSRNGAALPPFRRFLPGLLLIACALFQSANVRATGFLSEPSLTTARTAHNAIRLQDGRVLVTGGVTTANAYVSSTEIYDPIGNVWHAGASLTPGRYGHRANLLPSGKVLVTGGWSANGILATSQIYDPVSDTWASTTSMSVPRAGHTTTSLPVGTVLACGGNNGLAIVASCERYDPVTNQWAAVASMASARRSHSATLLSSGNVLFAGGYNGAYLDSAEIYDPVADMFAATGSLAIGRNAQSDTLLPSGKVLVTGGGNASGYLGSVELYDPVTGGWTMGPALSTPRIQHTANLLSSGKVLVVAGAYGVDLDSAEMYDPNTNSWMPAGNLFNGRYAHSATPVDGDRVLIAGGYSRQWYVASVEMYSPATVTSFVSISPAVTVVGQSYDVTLSVAGSTGMPTGSVTVTDNLGASCAPVVLSGGVGSCSLRSTHAGTRTLTAHYVPDNGAFAESSGTSSHDVHRADTTIAGFPTPTTSVWGQSVVYTAYVSEVSPAVINLSGDVVFSDGTHSCVAPVADGAASCSFVPSAIGNYSVSANYLGDQDSNPGIAAITTNVGQAYTAVAMQAVAPATVVVGQPVTLNSDVFVISPGLGPATGTVSMNNGSQGCGGVVDANGHAACVATFTMVGWYAAHAYFGGDNHYFPSNSSDVTLMVAAASTATVITSQIPTTSVIDEPVTFSFATTAQSPSTSIPSGSVTIGDGNQTCSAPLDETGHGSCAIAFANGGTRHVAATFGGGLNYNASVSPSVDHVVSRFATTLAIDSHAPDPSTPTQGVTVLATLSATVAGSGTPTGSITIGDGVDTCTILVGQDHCVVVLGHRGTRTLMATYSGDARFATSTAQATHHVNRLPIASATSYGTNEDVQLQILPAQGLIANAVDTDGDTLTITNPGALAAAGIGGTVVLNADGGFSYTPPADANGTATFDYSISDGHESINATATITVAAVNDAPEFGLAALQDWPAGASGAKEQAGFASVLRFGPVDEAGQHVQAWHVRTISDPNGVANGVSIALDGTLSYTLSGHAGSATFGVVLQDDGGTANAGSDTAPEQTFSINVAAALDLSVSIDDGIDFAPGGGIVVYSIGVQNDGPNDAVGARVKDLLPSSLVNAAWTCEGSVGTSCTAGGSGDIDDMVTIPSGATLTYVLSATIVATPEIPLENTATVIAPANVPDTNSANNAATDTDTVGIFADGFDKETVVGPGGKTSAKIAARIPRSSRRNRAAMTFSHARAFPSDIARGA